MRSDTKFESFVEDIFHICLAICWAFHVLHHVHTFTFLVFNYLIDLKDLFHCNVTSGLLIADYRFLIDKCQSLLLQKFKLHGVVSQVSLCPHEYNGSSRTEMGDFWDPFGHQVLQTGGVVDSDTDQDDILEHRSASSSGKLGRQQSNLLTVSG